VIREQHRQQAGQEDHVQHVEADQRRLVDVAAPIISSRTAGPIAGIDEAMLVPTVTARGQLSQAAGKPVTTGRAW